MHVIKLDVKIILFVFDLENNFWGLPTGSPALASYNWLADWIGKYYWLEVICQSCSHYLCCKALTGHLASRFQLKCPSAARRLYTVLWVRVSSRFIKNSLFGFVNKKIPILSIIWPIKQQRKCITVHYFSYQHTTTLLIIVVVGLWSYWLCLVFVAFPAKILSMCPPCVLCNVITTLWNRDLMTLNLSITTWFYSTSGGLVSKI